MADGTRVRIGFKPTAKGTIGIDVTSEAPDVEVAGKLLRDGIVEFKKVANEEGFTVIVGEAS